MKLSNLTSNLKEARYHDSSLTIECPVETMNTLHEWINNNNLEISPKRLQQALENYLVGSLHDTDQIIKHIREWEEDIISDV